MALHGRQTSLVTSKHSRRSSAELEKEIVAREGRDARRATCGWVAFGLYAAFALFATPGFREALLLLNARSVDGATMEKLAAAGKTVGVTLSDWGLLYEYSLYAKAEVDHIMTMATYCKIVMLSRFVALSVSLTRKVSLLQTR